MTPGEKLNEIASLDDRLVIGLSSGTSFDGIDAALVRITGRGDDICVELLSFACVPFEPSLRDTIREQSFAPPLGQIPLLMSELGSRASLVGAAYLASLRENPPSLLPPPM